MGNIDKLGAVKTQLEKLKRGQTKTALLQLLEIEIKSHSGNEHSLILRVAKAKAYAFGAYCRANKIKGIPKHRRTIAELIVFARSLKNVDLSVKLLRILLLIKQDTGGEFILMRLTPYKAAAFIYFEKTYKT